MIYLITGSPGVGKTAMVVDMILSNFEGLFKFKTLDGTEIDRPLYFCHIDGLDERKFKAHRLTEEQLQSAPLKDIVPEGSVVIVDECDYTYPVRSASREPPPYVQTLKELRHAGFTLILMTQHPSMIDRYVRNLVGKHIHIERKQLKTKRYEWYRCEENLNSTSFQAANWSYYKPPKRAFAYYKSASTHIKFTKKFPKVLFVAPLLVFAFLYGVSSFVGKFNQPKDKVAENTVSVASAPSISAVEEMEKPVAPQAASAPSVAVRDASAPMGTVNTDFEPAIPDKPETAPIYDSLRRAVNMETVAGCVATSTSCNCYSEQATPVRVSVRQCREYAENGVFQIYKNMDGGRASVQSAAPVAAVK